MARPIYEFELTDPDFTWLINQYQERFQDAVLIGSTSTPMMFIRLEDPNRSTDEDAETPIPFPIDTDLAERFSPEE